MAEKKTKEAEVVVKTIGVVFPQREFTLYENKKQVKENNVCYCLDGVDIFFPTGKTVYQASLTDGKLISISTSPTLVEMIANGSYEHTFNVDDTDVDDKTAVITAHANIGEHPIA